MKHSEAARILGGVTTGALILLAAVAHADENRSLTGPATEEEITALIRDLSDPSFEIRQYATRRLCAIGMPAAKQLRAQADGKDAETALRARAVLSALDRLMFTGVEIRLSFSNNTIAWDESTDLMITLANDGKYPARVPFAIGPTRPTVEVDDARQVGDMLDVADLLRVRHSDGTNVDLTVDDIGANPQVVAAVQARLNGGPTSVLDPGATVTVTVRAFNRGWARYRVLDADAYTVVMDYMPDWEDDLLAAQRIGRVVSNATTLTVTKPAPPAVSRDGFEASMEIERSGPAVIARLTNRTDQTMLVNKNFGRSMPFASGQWIYEHGTTRHQIPVIPKEVVSWDDFDPAMLVALDPGQAIELTRIPVTELHRRLVGAGAVLDGDRWTLHFRYANLCNHQWQARQGTVLLGNPKAPAIFREPLPRQILSTTQTSNHLTAPGEE